MKWIKLATDFFEDEKIIIMQTMPQGEALVTTWLRLLCLAGKKSRGGVFTLPDGSPMTDEVLAAVLRCDAELLKYCLGVYESLAMTDRVGGALRLTGWCDFQSEGSYGAAVSANAKGRSAAAGSSPAASAGRDNTASVSAPDCENTAASGNGGAVPASGLSGGVTDAARPAYVPAEGGTLPGDEALSALTRSDSALAQAISDFALVRASRGRPMTDAVKKRVAESLARLPASQRAAAVRRSADNGWLWIYPPTQAATSADAGNAGASYDIARAVERAATHVPTVRKRNAPARNNEATLFDAARGS